MSVIFENVDKIVNASGVGIDFAQGVGGGSSKKFVATGNIGQGQTVGLKADGTVEVIKVDSQNIASSFGSAAPIKDYTMSHSQTSEVECVYHPTQNKIVIFWKDGQWYEGKACVGTVNGDNITFGSWADFDSGHVHTIRAVYDPINDGILVVYIKPVSGSGNLGYANYATVSGNTITFMGNNQIGNGDISSGEVEFDPNSGKFIYVFKHTVSSYPYAQILTKNASNIGVNVATVLTSKALGGHALKYNPSVGKVVWAKSYYGHNSSSVSYLTISGSSIVNTEVMGLFGRDMTGCRLAFNEDSQNMELYFQEVDNGTGNSTKLQMMTLYLTSGSATKSAATEISTHDAAPFAAIYSPYHKRTIVTYVYSYASFVINVDNSGASPSFQGQQLPPTVHPNNTAVASVHSPTYFPSLAYNSAENKIVTAYLDGDWVDLRTINPEFVLNSYNVSSWLGIADEVITSGDSGKINLIGSVDSHQTGLTTGNTYYVNYDGTLTDTPNEGVENGTYGKIGKALSSTSLLLSK